MYARSGIEQAPLQTYVTAALFAPSRSVVPKIVGKTTLVSCVKRSPPRSQHWSALLLTLEGHSDWVLAIQFSPDGKRLASASRDKKVIVWDVSTGAKQHTLGGHSDRVNALQFSPDGSKLASASDDNKVIVWNPSIGARLHTLEGHSGVVTAVQFSPDGSKLASASHDNKVIVWNTSTGARLHTLGGHSDWVEDVQFSPDGSKLASASDDKKAMVWDASTGAHLHTLEGHSAWVKAVQFSRDGKKLASASSDEQVILWDVNTTSQIENIDVGGYVSDLAFSADGCYLKTNIGSFKLRSTVETPHDDTTYSLHLQIQEAWIFRYGHKLIWLPQELRPLELATAVRGAIVTFGYSSGAVLFWEICA
jgi:WD40 repeat protein